MIFHLVVVVDKHGKEIPRHMGDAVLYYRLIDGKCQFIWMHKSGNVEMPNIGIALPPGKWRSATINNEGEIDGLPLKIELYPTIILL